MKRFLILALAPVMKLWTWHVLRKCRCGVCGKIGDRRDVETMLGRCAECYATVLLDFGKQYMKVKSSDKGNAK